MSRRWAWLTSLVALALLAIWQVPKWLDWTRYRTTIEVLAGKTLGQPVSIRGPISLTLLPQPVLTAAQVSVGGSGPNDLSINVDALRLRVALWPLLGGRVDASELVLRGPNLRIPWPAQPGMLRVYPPSWLAAFAARIENGRVTAGRLAFTDVDARLATLDTGALSASGTAQVSGQPWHFTARLTTAGADGAAGLDFSLDGEGKADGLSARFTGQMASDGTLVGTVTGRGPDLAVLLPAPAVPFRADGRLTVGGGLVAADDLALNIGGSPASAAVALRVAPQERLDIALSASRLDLEAWLPVLLRTGTTIAGIDLPIGFDFSAESAPLGGGTLEHLRAAFELRDTSLVVREASARLPGNATLQLTGRIARDPARPSFEGDARLIAPVLRTTLRWLQQTMPRIVLPEGVPQRAELSGHLLVGNGAVSLQHITGSLDDTTIAGSIAFKRGEPPAVTADLSLDHLSLDPWLPTSPPTTADVSRFASRLDAEVQLNIRRAMVAGSTVHDLAVDAAIEAGNLLVRRLEGTTSGAHVVASGMLHTDGRLSDGRLSIDMANAAPFADMLPTAWRATPALWQGPAKLVVQANGPPNALALGVRLSLADAQLVVDPTIDLTSREWSGTLTLRHPEARQLIATLGLPGQIGLGDGSLSLVAHVAGAPGHLAVEKFDLTAAALHATGNLVLDEDGPEPLLSGRVYANELRLPRPRGASDVPLPLAMLRGWRGQLDIGIGRLAAGIGTDLRDASASVSVTNEKLRVDRFSARLGSGTLSATFGCDAGSSPPSLSLQASLSDVSISGALADAPIDLLSGRANGSLELAASGYSPATMLATMAGRATLSVTGGVLSGFDMSKLNQAVARPDPKTAEAGVGDALRSGATGFDRLDIDARVGNGDISLDSGLLTTASGTARFNGRMNLRTQTLDVAIALQPATEKSPQIALRLSGPVDHPQRTPELADLVRWMAESVH